MRMNKREERESASTLRRRAKDWKETIRYAPGNQASRLKRLDEALRLEAIAREKEQRRRQEHNNSSIYSGTIFGKRRGKSSGGILGEFGY